MLMGLGRHLPPIRRLMGKLDAVTAERDSLQTQLDAANATHAHQKAARNTRRLIETDYAYAPRPRQLATSATGRHLMERFARDAQHIAGTLDSVLPHAPSLSRIPGTATGGDGPFWQNGWFPGLDAAVLYALVANLKPRRYIEIGSGNSTRFAAQAIRDNELKTSIVAIDPTPRAEVASLCDALHRTPLEDFDPSFWTGLSSDDLIFLDSSHRSFQNSDVTVFFTEILPMIPTGTVYGLHDICLPHDYPEAWTDRFYNEQYLLAAHLMNTHDTVLLPAFWASQEPDLHNRLTPLWQAPALVGAETHGHAFWLRRG